MDKLWYKARRVISMVLVFAMLASITPIQVFAEGEDTGVPATTGEVSDVTTESVPEADPVPEPDPEPVVESEPAPEPEPEPEPDPQPETIPEPEPEPDPQPETAPATQPETAPATQPETAPATQPETAPATQPETAPATQPETAPATQPETAPATQPETAPATQPTTDSVPAADPNNTPDANQPVVLDEAVVYTVTFEYGYDYDNNPETADIIVEQEIQAGKDAIAPEIPDRQGYTFKGWDRAFTNVQSDLTVKAQWEEISTATVTVHYRYANGTEAAPDYKETVIIGQPYNKAIPIPAITKSLTRSTGISRTWTMMGTRGPKPKNVRALQAKRRRNLKMCSTKVLPRVQFRS